MLNTLLSHADITAMYRNLEQADLDVAGSNIKERRSAMILGGFNDDAEQRDDTWRHLLSLNRTLKVSLLCYMTHFTSVASARDLNVALDITTLFV